MENRRTRIMDFIDSINDSNVAFKSVGGRIIAKGVTSTRMTNNSKCKNISSQCKDSINGNCTNTYHCKGSINAGSCKE